MRNLSPPNQSTVVWAVLGLTGDVENEQGERERQRDWDQVVHWKLAGDTAQLALDSDWVNVSDKFKVLGNGYQPLLI